MRLPGFDKCAFWRTQASDTGLTESGADLAIELLMAQIVAAQRQLQCSSGERGLRSEETNAAAGREGGSKGPVSCR